MKPATRIRLSVAIALVLTTAMPAPAAIPDMTSPPAKPPPPASPAQVPAGCWPAERAERLEKSLDAFFAEPDAAKRRDLYQKDLAPQQVGLTLDELQTTLKAEPPEDKKTKGGVVRAQTPWLKDHPRGWFNFAMPQDYNPKKAWGLCVALHGGGGDGDNVVRWYQRFTRHGYFVIYPTSLQAGGMWSNNAEVVNVYRLIEWAARRYRIDFRRLIITGASMGGIGTWMHLMSRPELWQAGASMAAYPPVSSVSPLEKLRGVPFYVVHGEKDAISVEGPRRAVEELRRRGIEVTYVEAPGAGHTVPDRFWFDMIDWLARQPPKPWSPRPLFLPPEGKRSLAQIQADPLDWAADPSMKLIREGKYAEARAELTKRIGQSPSDARLHMMRAMAALPALAKPLPDVLNADAFKDAGWSGPDAQAYADLCRALSATGGVENAPKEFQSSVHLMLAKIWAKRFVADLGNGGVAWVNPFNSCAAEVSHALRLNPQNLEAFRLGKALNASNPARR